MTESLGTARLDIVVDTSSFDAAINSAKNRMSSMSAVAQQEYAKLAGAEKRRVDSLITQADMLGKTRQEQILYNAALKGAPTAVLEDIKRRLAGVREETAKNVTETRQYQAALRGVPAQITDIVTSLQGGQKPLTVLFQQGGQLKDMFGGIQPAATALTQTISGMLNPVTLTGAALLTLAAAAYQGAEEQQALARAIAITGNVSGTTVAQLDRMSAAIASSATTQSQAADALSQVVSSGKFAEDQFQAVASAAVNMERETGQSIDDTIAIFAKLADDPVRAVAELNKAQHFLTETTYQQIKALQEQGDTQAAATLAIESYADTVNRRTADVAKNVGFLTQRWRELQAGALAAWNAMMDVGRPDTLREKVDTLRDQIDALENNPLAYLDKSAEQKKQLAAEKKAEIKRLLREDTANNRAEYLKATRQQANDYAIALDQEVAAHGSADQKRARQIEESRKASDAAIAKAAAAGDTALANRIRAQQTQLEANINAEGAKKKPAGGARAINRADLRADLSEIRSQLESEQAAIANNRRITDAEYSAKLITVEEYYKRQRDEIAATLAAQEKAAAGELAALRGSKASGADAIRNKQQIAEIESKLAQQRAAAATQQKAIDIQETRTLEDRKDALEAYVNACNMETIAIQRNFGLQAARVGLGQREFAMLVALTDIQEKYAATVDKLERDRNAQNDADTTARINEATRARDEQIAATRAGYAQLVAAQGSALNGLNAGLQDWIAGASDVADQVHDITTHSLDTIADGIVNAAETGKLAWKDMLKSILVDIEKFLARQAVLKLVELASSFFGPQASVRQTGVSTTGTGQNMAGFAAKGAYFDGQFAAFAKGGAFTNSIVNSPTPFLFGNGGKFGVMGEAGPEAVMPLQRDSSGRLGVVAAGMGGGAVMVNIETNITSDGTTSQTSTSGGDAASVRKFAETMAGIARGEIVRSMQPNGDLWNAGVRQP